MYKTLNRVSLISSFALGLLLLLFVGATANAEEQRTEVAQVTDTQNTATSYDYTAKAGDNLSKLVRRSIQLLNEARSNTLTEAAAMYCETNAVQRLGSAYLDIDQKVSIPFSVLQEYIDNAKNLTAAQLARWQKYADQADFDVASVMPDNIANAQSQATPPPAPTTEGQEGQQPEQSTQTNNQPAEQNNNSSLAWYWWVLGILGIGAVYYLAGRRISK